MPLIVLIVIFAVSVLGLSLIPGQDAQGRPDRMGIFDVVLLHELHRHHDRVR